MTVAEEVLSVSPSSIDFGTEQTDTIVQITNQGGGMLEWSISATAVPWIASISPSYGSGYTDIEVTADRSMLTGGFHADSISITSNGGDVGLPITIQQTLLLNANFDSDQADARPDTALSSDSPIDDRIRIRHFGSSAVRVRPFVGSLNSKPIEINQAVDTDGIELSAFVSGGAGCDSITVSWQSLATSDTSFAEFQLIGTNDAMLAKVIYLEDRTLYYWSGGPPDELLVKYSANIHKSFEILIDFVAETTSLSINGVAQPGFQAVGFGESADGFVAIRFKTNSRNAQVFAIDNIQATAGTCGPSP
jgi:hypothetical protein